MCRTGSALQLITRCTVLVVLVTNTFVMAQLAHINPLLMHRIVHLTTRRDTQDYALLLRAKFQKAHSVLLFMIIAVDQVAPI